MIQTLYKNKVTGVLGIAGVIAFFIAVTFFANEYQHELQQIVLKGGRYGVVFYVFITAFATVIAPLSALPLMPLAVSVWGWPMTGVLSVVGWVLGSQTAFYLARRYGKSLIQKMVSLEKLARYESVFSEKNLFWSVVLLRMTIPVDILSYALGLFTTMSHRLFFFSTLLGVTPFAFILAYTGSLSPVFQIYTAVVALFFITSLYVVKNRN